MPATPILQPMPTTPRGPSIIIIQGLSQVPSCLSPGQAVSENLILGQAKVSMKNF